MTNSWAYPQYQNLHGSDHQKEARIENHRIVRLTYHRDVIQGGLQMPFALKVGQRTRLHVAFLRVDGTPGHIAGIPIWTSSNPAMVRIVEDPFSPDGRSVYAECLGPVDPSVTAHIVEMSCAGEVDLGTGVRVIETLPFEIQPQAAETTAAVITAEVPII